MEEKPYCTLHEAGACPQGCVHAYGLDETIAQARAAQQLHEQRHDVQLEIVNVVPIPHIYLPNLNDLFGVSVFREMDSSGRRLANSLDILAFTTEHVLAH